MKEDDPHSAARFVQMTMGSLKQVYDGIFNSNYTMINKLQWVLEGASLFIQVDQ